MTHSSLRSTIGCGCLALLALGGCRQAPEGWTPVLEETSTIFLRNETESVAAHVRAAAEKLPDDTAAAAVELKAAEDGLDHLLTYYLPLLRAREHAYNAYRHYFLGRVDLTSRELDQVEEVLLAVSSSGHGHLLREMEEPLATLGKARAALEVDSGEAREALETLATRLDFLLVKGGLVLSE